MDPKQFRDSLSAEQPPSGISSPAKALWAAAKRDWQRAEDYIRGDDSKEACWVRAHMNRAQGNLVAADEWYAKAGRPQRGDSVDDEVSEIAAGLLLHFG